MNSIAKLCVLLLSIGLLLACDRKDPLPKPTQEGKNTFGCKIDGKPWVPDGGTGFQATKPLRGGFFSISTYPVLQTGIYNIYVLFLKISKRSKFSLTEKRQESTF